MLEFVFSGGDNLSRRYKRNLARRLERAIVEQGILQPNPDAEEVVLVGDWTLYLGNEMPTLVFDRETIKNIILHIKKIKV